MISETFENIFLAVVSVYATYIGTYIHTSLFFGMETKARYISTGMYGYIIIFIRYILCFTHLFLLPYSQILILC